MPPSTLLSPPPPPERQASNENNEELTNLPEDQVFEVLTRVPLDDLAACRAVSTRWRAITYEPAFAPLHCRRADAFSGYLVQSTTRYGRRAGFVSAHPLNPPLSLDFVPRAGRPWRRDDVRVVAVAPRMGLACCVSAGSGNVPARYYVCKPATQQWRALPNPRLRFQTRATAMAARPSSDDQGAVEFRIVRLSTYIRGQYNSLRCEVFDSRRFAWRRAEDVPLPSISLRAGEPAVHAHGAAHWLCWPDWNRVAAQVVFALDVVGTGDWRLIALPLELEDAKKRDTRLRKQITVVEGRLCLMVTTGFAMQMVLEVWEMANYAEARWEKKTRVSLKRLYEGEDQGLILQHLDSSGVAFLETSRRALWYDFQRGRKIAEVQVDHGNTTDTFKFESDMIPCQMMGGRPCYQSSSPAPFASSKEDDAMKVECI
ncbi:hypothetical protein U9M48_037893 [Paspalum notatum var. saurae]|uniref:F-box domain-containing protein n=1 Tax=Paspalum notatum var. saurae TaxID=547442 RepID=A0AAQ3XCW8_PASNO